MDGRAEQDGRNSGGRDQKRGRQRRTGQADVRRHFAQTQAARHLRPPIHRSPLRVHFFQTGLRIYRREFGMKISLIRNEKNLCWRVTKHQVWIFFPWKVQNSFKKSLENQKLKKSWFLFQRILALMDVSDLDVLIEVLRLLQIMGKRSKFLTQRLKPEDQTELVQNLTAIAQVSWERKYR